MAERSGVCTTGRAPDHSRSMEDRTMAITHPIPVDVLRQLVRLDPETGRLYWLPRKAELTPSGTYSAERRCAAWNAKWPGTEALATPDQHGYRGGRIFNHHYKAHRVVFALIEGRWPTDEIDHINGDPSDNRFANLREASRSDNVCNRRGSLATSARKGVYWAKHANMWRVECKTRQSGRLHRVHVGYFKDENEAALAYDKAARELHGEFARLNFPD